MKHILIVDDEPQLLATLDLIISGGGYKTTLAYNARKALRIIQFCLNTGNPVDLLITDIHMPVISGLQLIDELKSLNLNLPVLAITGYSDKDQLKELSSRGIRDLLEKPFGPPELLNHVEKYF